MKDMTFATRPLVEPRQKRAKETYRSLLGAAQEILSQEGLEALNSNAIVERAGTTAPSFYRYFENKHGILAVLGTQLMENQDEVVLEGLGAMQATGDTTGQAEALLWRTLEVTEAFEGGYALMVSLRAIPALQTIRLASHHMVASRLADRYLQLRPDVPRDEAYDRCRLANELGYACMEMLLETSDCDRERVIRLTAEAINTVLWR